MAAGRQLARSLTAQLSATVLERLFQAGALILIARQVGPSAFGQYAACIALTKILSVAFALGLDIWLLRNGYREGNATLLAARAAACLRIKFWLGLLWLAGIALLSSWLSADIYPPTLLMVTAAAVWFEDLANLAWSTFKAALQNQVLLRFITLAQAVTVAVVLALIALGARAVLNYAVAVAVVTGFHALVAIGWQVRSFGWQRQAQPLLPLFLETLPFGLSVGLAMIYGRADIAMVGYWLGERAVGFYSPAASLATALALIPTAIYYVMLPVLSRAYMESMAGVGKLIVHFVAASVVLGGVAGAILALVAHPLANLIYGPAFVETGAILALLSGVLAARFVSTALATALVAVGQQNQRVGVQAIVALLNIALNLWVITRWGLMGVAGVYVFTEWTLVICYAALLWYWRRAGRHAKLSPQRAEMGSLADN